MTDTITTPSALDVVSDTFTFDIEKVPLQFDDGVGTPWFGLRRSDNQAMVGEGSVTERYVPHQTDDVLALVEACQESFEDCDAKAYFRNGHYVSLSPSEDYRVGVYSPNNGEDFTDNVWPRLVIRGSFERRAFSVSLGYYRDACSNLHIPRLVSGTCEKIRHNNNLRSNMNELIGHFETLKNSWQTMSTFINNMQARKISLAAFVGSVYPEPDEDATENVKTRYRNLLAAINRRVTDERIRTGRDIAELVDVQNSIVRQDAEVSLWEAFNGVQGYVQHVASRKNNASDWDRVVLASRDPNVKRAEELALSLVS